MPSMLSDTAKLSENQKELLCRLLFEALIEIRFCLWKGQVERATSLTDAIHNVPNHILNDFSFRYFRMGLEAHSKTHGCLMPLLTYLDLAEKDEPIPCPTPPSAHEKT